MALVQAEFLQRRLRPRLKQAERGRRSVLFVDAAHFVDGPVLGFVWCLVRPSVRAPAGRQRYSVLGALDAIAKRVVRVTTTGGVGSDAVCDLLRAVAAADVSRPITLVLDNARYQHTAAVKALARALRIELLYLPSYSPNLNLIERLWKFVKKEALASRYRATFAEFANAIDDCLQQLPTRYRAPMDSPITTNFQTFGFEPVLAAKSIYSMLVAVIRRMRPAPAPMRTTSETPRLMGASGGSAETRAASVVRTGWLSTRSSHARDAQSRGTRMR